MPTAAEWVDERGSWGSSDAGGAYASPLKLPLSGYRFISAGTILNAGEAGYYWSSTVNDYNSMCLIFDGNSASSIFFQRSLGLSVRCIRD